jgi:hypothetical protein
LTTLYKVSGESQVFKDPDTKRKTLDAEETQYGETAGKATLKNVLYFWVRFGYLPWWAGKYDNISPTALLEQLIQESPAEALNLLKHSGLKLFTRRRLVYQISLPVLLKLFQLVPHSDEALKYSGYLAAMLRENKKAEYPDMPSAESILLFLLWDTFIEASYKSFKPELFLRAAFENLTLWSGIPAPELFGSAKVESYPEQFADLFRKVYQAAALPENAPVGFVPQWSAIPETEQLISPHLKSELPPEEIPAKSDIAAEALFLLRYFLQYNKLPAHYKITAELSVNAFLKQLLLLLHKERPSELASLLRSDSYSGEAFIRIHEIFAAANTIEESSINKLLLSNLEKDILLYIRQKGGIAQSDRSMIELVDLYLKRSLNADTIEFLSLLFKYASISMHLAYYYENETAYSLLKSGLSHAGWGEQTAPFLKAFNLWILEIVQDSVDQKHLDLLFRTFCFMMIGGSIRVRSVKEYLHYFFRFLFERDYQTLLKIAGILGNKELLQKEADPVITKVIPVMKQELRIYSEQDKSNNKLMQLMAESDEEAMKALRKADLKKQKEEELRQLKKELEQQKEEEKKKAEEENAEDPGTIYINNAGLVLLHPFLSTYFTRLEMLEKGDFISEEARHRAVHLLQYLVYGTEKNEEQDLVLNKILCNMPVEEPVELEIILTEKEKTISTELLNAVIIQWEKLKNTSIEGLQTSFLQRQGGLVKNEENWTLRVEQRGYDVLLHTLPWGVGMVKTPWMSEIIYVEWM